MNLTSMNYFSLIHLRGPTRCISSKNKALLSCHHPIHIHKNCILVLSAMIHIAEGGRVGKKSCKQLPLTKLCERREKKVLKTRQTGKLHSPRASNKRQKNKMIRMLVKSAVKCRVFSRNEASNTSSLPQ